MARSESHALDKHGHFISADTDEKTTLEKLLDVVERVGNRVPHPVIIFVLLIGLVILLSQLLYWANASVTYETVNPETHQIENVTTGVRSLLTTNGVRFMYSGVQNFMNFTAVGVIIVAMLGVGVADLLVFRDRGLLRPAVLAILNHLANFGAVEEHLAHEVHPEHHHE